MFPAENSSLHVLIIGASKYLSCDVILDWLKWVQKYGVIPSAVLNLSIGRNILRYLEIRISAYGASVSTGHFLFTETFGGRLLEAQNHPNYVMSEDDVFQIFNSGTGEVWRRYLRRVVFPSPNYLMTKLSNLSHQDDVVTTHLQIQKLLQELYFLVLTALHPWFDLLSSDLKQRKPVL